MVPRNDCVVRHCKKRYVDGGIVSPSAFHLKPARTVKGKRFPTETYLSVCWLELHGGDLNLIRNDIPLQMHPKERLAILNVNDIVTSVIAGGLVRLSVKRKPRSGYTNDSHCGIAGYGLTDNDSVGKELCDLIQRVEPAVP